MKSEIIETHSYRLTPAELADAKLRVNKVIADLTPRQVKMIDNMMGSVLVTIRDFYEASFKAITDKEPSPDEQAYIDAWCFIFKWEQEPIEYDSIYRKWYIKFNSIEDKTILHYLGRNTN